jgi:hypothetical protein
MAIISAISAVDLFTVILVNDWMVDEVGAAVINLEIVMGLAMLVLGVATAALTCRPLCCRRPVAGMVHLASVTTSQPTVLPVNMPASLPAGLLRGQENPPSYTDVANSGGKYQKF